MGACRRLPIFVVDAFTSAPFKGNPAAVCPLESWLPDAALQSIASEMNLSETAFFVCEGGDFRLRWVTPTREVDLCGHATLASACALFTKLEPGRESVTFSSRSGPLGVARDGGRIVLDFPSRPTQPAPARDDVAAALGRAPREIHRGPRDSICLFEDAREVRELRPDFGAIARLEGVFAVCVTAPGTGADADVDFVSRFLRPGRRDRRGSRHRIGALLADAVLGGSPRQDAPRGAASEPPRRRHRLRARRRSRSTRAAKSSPSRTRSTRWSTSSTASRPRSPAWPGWSAPRAR